MCVNEGGVSVLYASLTYPSLQPGRKNLKKFLLDMFCLSPLTCRNWIWALEFIGPKRSFGSPFL